MVTRYTAPAKPHLSVWPPEVEELHGKIGRIGTALAEAEQNVTTPLLSG
jgi:hypothetical protein